MLGFVQSWFAPSANPIGVDFGSDSLRMAQVEAVGGGGLGDFKLVAAARADVPSHVRHDSAAKLAFFQEAIRDLWSQGNFRGRKAILALPAASMTIQHMRVARMDDEALKQALPWEARGKLPYDPSHALLRHLVAGEIYQDGEPRNEVIVMAAQREWVNQLLAAAARAKLDVVGMNVEPRALVDCFGHVYRRKSDTETTDCFVDIGCVATRTVIARAGQILFARVVPVGGDHFTRAVANALKMGFEDAKMLRIKVCHAQQAPAAPAAPAPPSNGPADGCPGSPTPSPVAAPVLPEPPAPSPEAQAIEQACREPLAKLVEELSLCRRYHEATFQNLPIGRLVFVGGEARHRWLCLEIARAMDLAAQVGDPMVRMARTTELGPESGIDRRLPQPDWAIALGLTMGPTTAAQSAPVAAAAAR